MKSYASISTAHAPAPLGHYSQATVCENTIFVSGQLAPCADGSHTHDKGFDVQARQSLENVLAIVEAAGGRLESVVKVTAYIVGVGNWPLFNEIYAQVFGEWKPARSVVPVPELHHGYLIEIDAVAHKVT